MPQLRQAQAYSATPRLLAQVASVPAPAHLEEQQQIVVPLEAAILEGASPLDSPNLPSEVEVGPGCSGHLAALPAQQALATLKPTPLDRQVSGRH